MLPVLLFALILLLGLEFTIILGIKAGFPERLSLSFLLGIGFLTFAAFLLAYFFNLNFSLVNTFVVLISLCVVFFIFKFKRIIIFFSNIKFRKVTIKPKVVIFWGFILAIFSFTLLANIYWPISDWDALAMYDFRAKVLMVDTNLVQAVLGNSYFLGYPLLTSLTHLFAYQAGLSNPKFIYSLFYLSFIITFYYSLRRNVGENKSIFFTLVLALVPEVLSNSMIAYTNLPYTVYLCTGIFYLFDWIKHKEHSYLVLSSVLVALSTWVRIAEMFWIAPILMVFVIGVRDKAWKEFVLYLITILVFYLPWTFFGANVGGMLAPTSVVIQPNYLEGLKLISFERLFLVFSYLYTSVFSTWGLIFLVFILIVVRALFKGNRDNNPFLLIILLFFILLFAGTLVFSTFYPGWDLIPDSARRMSIFFVPLILYLIALAI